MEEHSLNRGLLEQVLRCSVRLKPALSARGKPDFKLLQEENKFHRSLKSLELIYPSPFFSEPWEITIKLFGLCCCHVSGATI